MKYIILILCLSSSPYLLADDLSTIADQELSIPTVTNKTAKTEVFIKQNLQVVKPQQQMTSAYRDQFQIGYESFKAKGRQILFGQEFQLEQYQAFPFLHLAWNRRLWRMSDRFSAGSQVDLGYGFTNGSITSPSGISKTEVRLHSSLLTAALFAQYNFNQKFSLNAYSGPGVLAHIQSSPSSDARFSQNGWIGFYGAKLHYDFSYIGVWISLENRLKLGNKDTVETTSNNFLFGLSYRLNQ